MVLEILGVVKLVPVAKELPPLTPAYQLIVPPAQPVAVSITVPVPHLPAPVGVGALTLFTVAVTATLVDVQPLMVQPT